MPTSLSKIKISNFKSFRGEHVIGTLGAEQLIAVIGKNGWGKSNLMDAIAFALGESKDNLRCNDANDCKYKDQCGNIDPLSETYVEVTLKFDDGTTQTFKRSIVNDKTRCFIEDKRIKSNQYIEELKKHGLNTESSNFLVFQGNIDKIIDATAQDRAKMFEEISGSIEHKEEYEQMKQERDSSASALASLLNEKRVLKQEEKGMQMVVGNMDKQEDYHQRFETLKSEYFLFSIYCVDRYIENLEEIIENHNEKINALNEEKSEKNSEFEESKKSYNKKLEDFESIQSEQNTSKEEVKKFHDEMSNVDEKIKFSRKILSRNKKMLESDEKFEKQREINLKELEKELALIKSKKETLDNTIRQIERDGQQLAEYHKLCGEVSVKCADPNPVDEKEISSSLEQKEKETTKLNQIKFDIQQQLKAENSVNSTIKECEKFRTELQTSVEKICQTITNLKQSILSQEELSAHRYRLEQINKEVDAMDVDKHWKNQQLEAKRIVEILQNEVHGVHDRFSRLCYPTHNRYIPALIRVSGLKYSAIIVDDKKVAFECIKCLQRHRLPPQTFLPIDGAKGKTFLNEKLRSITEPKMVKLIYDVLKFDDKYEPIVRRVVQSTLVCETDEDAKNVAYNCYKTQNDGFKKIYAAVSLNGIFFKKNGSFTGGLGVGASRNIDPKRYDILVAEKREILDKIWKHNNLNSSETQSKIKELENEKLLIERKLLCYERSKRSSLSEKKIINDSLIKLENEKKNVEEKVNKLEEKERTLNEKMIQQKAEYENEIETIKRNIFADFCLEYGIENIQEYEESVKVITEKNAEIAKLNEKGDRVRELLNFEKNNTSYQERIGNLTEKIRKLEENIQEMVAKKEELELASAKLEEKINSHAEQLESLKTYLENFTFADEERTKGLNEIKHQLSKLVDEVVEFHRKKSEKTREKHDLLLKAKMTSVFMPMLEGSLEDLFSADESRDSWDDIELQERQLKFDYSLVPEEKLNETIKENVEKISEDYKQELATLADALKSSTIPDIKNKLKTVKNKLSVINKKIEEQKKSANIVDESFKSIKANRQKKFLKFFGAVEESLLDIYQSLLGSENAQAFLITPNPDEPYLQGINYECVPDSKKRKPMSSLSGGERTMAGLALLFALRSASPPPFLIMDEVDGSLDKNHIYHLKNYFSNLTTQQQVILISLNFNVYVEADRIIGVTKVIRNYHESKTFVLDSKAYSQTVKITAALEDESESI